MKKQLIAALVAALVSAPAFAAGGFFGGSSSSTNAGSGAFAGTSTHGIAASQATATNVSAATLCRCGGTSVSISNAQTGGASLFGATHAVAGAGGHASTNTSQFGGGWFGGYGYGN
jgi:hypothetical protein